MVSSSVRVAACSSSTLIAESFSRGCGDETFSTTVLVPTSSCVFGQDLSIETEDLSPSGQADLQDELRALWCVHTPDRFPTYGCMFPGVASKFVCEPSTGVSEGTTSQELIHENSPGRCSCQQMMGMQRALFAETSLQPTRRLQQASLRGRQSSRGGEHGVRVCNGLLSKEIFMEACAPIFEKMVASIEARITKLANQTLNLPTSVRASTTYLASGVPAQPLVPGLSPSELQKNDEHLHEASRNCKLKDSCAMNTSSPLPTLLEKPRGSNKTNGGNGKRAQLVPVCHHWKIKGWCRNQDACKFAHPSHRKGVRMVHEPERSENCRDINLRPNAGVLVFAHHVSVVALPLFCPQQQLHEQQLSQQHQLWQQVQ